MLKKQIDDFMSQKEVIEKFNSFDNVIEAILWLNDAVYKNIVQPIEKLFVISLN